MNVLLYFFYFFIFIYILAEYDIRKDLTLKKNFTIGSKHPIRNLPLSSLAPKDSVMIRSDFDDILNHPKFA